MENSSPTSTLEKILKLQTELTVAKPDVPYLLDRITLRAKEITDSEGAVFELVEGEIQFESTKLQMKTSVGFDFYPVDGLEPETLMAIADGRLYENKRSRKKV